MKKLILALVAAAGFTFAQPTPPAALAPGEIVRVVEVTRGDPAAIVNTLSTVLPGIGRNGRLVIVRGPSAVVNMIEESIKKLDVLPPDVELTVQLLYGSAQESTGGAIPTDLESTVRQLRGLFPYKGYRVLDTLMIRAHDGRELQQRGTLPGGERGYQFSARLSVRAGGSPRTVSFQNLVLTISNNSEIRTDLDAREGQKTVVGKANVAGTDDAIILVITPKVIE